MSARSVTSVHEWFGLSYANYLVVPRTLMQSMPGYWQERMVACLRELNSAFDHIEQAEAYEVIPGQDVYLSDLTEEQAKRIGYQIDFGEDETRYYDRDGNEIDEGQADCYHVVMPAPDPVPHYNRGRTRVKPCDGPCSAAPPVGGVSGHDGEESVRDAGRSRGEGALNGQQAAG